MPLKLYCYNPPKDILERLTLASQDNADYEIAKRKIEENINFSFIKRF